jgi:hypothetical protein
MILQERTEMGTNFFFVIYGKCSISQVAFNAKPAKLISSVSNFNVYKLSVTVFPQNTFSYL